MPDTQDKVVSTTRTEIAEAIGAHGAWKTRLKAAALAGAANLDPATVADGHRCRFGLWIDGHIKAHPNDRDARRISDLHQQFHRCAGGVALSIREGRSAEALQDIETGRLKQITETLVAEMMAWRRKV